MSIKTLIGRGIEVYKKEGMLGFLKKLILNASRFLFSINKILVFKMDLESSNPPLIQPKKEIKFRFATKEDLRTLKSDDRYGIKKSTKKKIECLLDNGELCLLGLDGNEIVFYCWIQPKQREISPRQYLKLAPKQAFSYRCFTREDYRGLGIYPASLIYQYNFLERRGFKEFFIDVDSKNISSIRGIKKTGAVEIGHYFVINICQLSRAVVPKKTLLHFESNKVTLK